MLREMFDPPAIEPGTFRPLSRKEYERMVDLGMFEDERVELLRGVLVKMSPQGSPHGRAVTWLVRELVLALGRAFDVRPQIPFAADDCSVPEPDIVVTRPWTSASPHPDEALLVIEVADTSLRADRTVKLAIYAAAGIPEYWIVDVNTMTVEVHTQPVGESYAHRQVLRDGDMLRPTLLPGVELPVADIPR